ncbi:hypothetical protein [Neobacillus vireti]|uniref:hypothetical protein n=1 Tax=Neobacillus vireti TaxID=220686 RepID=UPI002FFF3195
MTPIVKLTGALLNNGARLFLLKVKGQVNGGGREEVWGASRLTKANTSIVFRIIQKLNKVKVVGGEIVLMAAFSFTIKVCEEMYLNKSK